MLQNAAMARTLNRRIGKMDPASVNSKAAVGQQTRAYMVGACCVRLDQPPSHHQRRPSPGTFVGRKCPARDADSSGVVGVRVPLEELDGMASRHEQEAAAWC